MRTHAGVDDLVSCRDRITRLVPPYPRPGGGAGCAVPPPVDRGPAEHHGRSPPPAPCLAGDDRRSSMTSSLLAAPFTTRSRRRTRSLPQDVKKTQTTRRRVVARAGKWSLVSDFSSPKGRPMDRPVITAVAFEPRRHVDLGKSRLETTALLTVGMIGARTVDLVHVADERGSDRVAPASTHRRLRRDCALFGQDSIAMLLADREFVGAGWFNWLEENDIPFTIRSAKNRLATRHRRLPGQDCHPDHHPQARSPLHRQARRHGAAPALRRPHHHLVRPLRTHLPRRRRPAPQDPRPPRAIPLPHRLRLPAKPIAPRSSRNTRRVVRPSENSHQRESRVV